MSEQPTGTFAQPDAAEFRSAMGRFPTGVAIIVSGTGDKVHAVTASSLTSISLDPLLLLISIRSDGKIRREIETARSFTVNFLTTDQENLARYFAQKDRPTGEAALDRIGRLTGPAGGVLVAGALASLECSLETQHTAGDHIIFLGRVRSIRTSGDKDRPLVFYRGEYSTVLPRPRSENYAA